jgi:hypothetical protein
MPQVTIKTGWMTPSGQEEILAEYMCDHSGCPNIGTQVHGVVRELGLAAVYCDEHASQFRS